MPKYLGDVRCWVNSEKHMLAWSFSGFDPKRSPSAAGGQSDGLLFTPAFYTVVRKLGRKQKKPVEAAHAA
jgi:hypothetical protein